jgi:transposase
LSSKVIVTATDESTAVVVDVISGQASEAPLLEPLLEQTIERVPVFDELVGDKRFDRDAPREACIDRNLFPNIPNRRNRIDPWGFLPEGYVERNRVEQLFGKLKQFRRVATRYEKLKETFLGLIHLALSFIRIRAAASVNTLSRSLALVADSWQWPAETTISTKPGLPRQSCEGVECSWEGDPRAALSSTHCRWQGLTASTLPRNPLTLAGWAFE